MLQPRDKGNGVPAVEMWQLLRVLEAVDKKPESIVTVSSIGTKSTLAFKTRAIMNLAAAFCVDWFLHMYHSASLLDELRLDDRN
jgi:hypothetical protein